MAINVPIITSFNGKGAEAAIKEFQNLTKASDKAAFAINKMAVPAALAFGAIVTGGYKAAQAASDFNESVSKSGIIFGTASAEIKAFADTAASSLGLSKQAALDAAATMGTFGKSAGLAGTDLSNFSIEMVKLSGDLASFHNANPADVALALGAALRGEAEPIRKFGVLLNDAAVKAQAMKMGLYDGTGALDAQAKVLATQKIILQQTSDAQGDFARTSDGAANQQRILAAQVSNAKVAIGQAFLPILEAVLPVLVNFATAIGNNTDAFIAVVAVIGTFAAAILTAKTAMALWKAASIITTAVNYALATSFTAVQVATGIGIISVVAGVAAFAAYTKKMNAARKESDLLNQQTLITAGTIGATGALMGPKGFIGPELSTDQLKQAYADFEKAKDAANSFGGGVDLAAEKLKKMKNAIKEASDALTTRMTASLDDAKDKLKTAQAAFDDFATNTSKSMLEAFNFTDAMKEGAETGKGFVSGLVTIADRAVLFTDKVKQLVTAGLSQDALGMVLAAGQEAGTYIADELINGGATAIEQTNKLVASAQTAADLIAQMAADKFYSAGVSNAQNYLKGVEDAMAVAASKLKGKGLTLADVKGISAGFDNAISAPINMAPYDQFMQNNGGLSMGANGNIVYNINVSGVMSNAQTGEEIINNIRAFNRAAGPANIAVA
jgi:hypothetical protein